MNNTLLPRGRWPAATYQALLDWLEQQRNNGHRHSSVDTPRFAVFDWDNTCIQGDIGAATWWQQIGEMRFCFEHPDFWPLFAHMPQARQIRSDAETALALPEQTRPDHPAYKRFLAAMINAYWDLEAARGPRASYPW